MDRHYIIENARERERIRNLVEGMSDEELQLPLYVEGWTIAVALAHLAFGDQRTLGMLHQWKTKGVTPEPAIDINNINDALVSLFLLIPLRSAADLAVSSAEILDKELEEIDLKLVEDISNVAPGRIFRSRHRKIHLDEIEELLQSRRLK
jgi:hypothetical protein